MAVLLAGPSTAPSLLRCQSVLLSDPKVPGSKQPYHAVLELPAKDAAMIAQKLRKVVSTAARRSAAALFKQAGEAGYAVRGSALVVGSLVDPASLHNEHIRAHGLEGQLFRTVLEDAFRSHEVPCEVLLEKTAYTIAATALRKSTVQAKRITTSLGDSHEGSWRSEEKLAALAAWMSLV